MVKPRNSGEHSKEPTKMTPRMKWGLIQRVIKEPKTTFKGQQASLITLHGSTFKKDTGQKRNSLESSKPKPTADTKPHLTFARKYPDDPNILGVMFCGLTGVNLNFIGICVAFCIWHQNKALAKKNIMTTVKNDSGSVMLLGCSATPWPEWLAAF